MAVTTSGLAPLCARVTLSPANRAITKSEIHNTGFFAFTALAPQFSSLAWGQLKHLGTEATSIKNILVGSGVLRHAPAAMAMLTIAADPKHLGDRIGMTAVLHTWGI